MDIYIAMLTGKKFSIHAESDDTILSVKHKIQDYEGIPPYKTRLIYNGIQLEDERTLSDYEIENEEIIHLYVLMRGD